MNIGLKGFCSGIISAFSQFSQVPVRYRYYADKIAKGPIVKKYGYVDKLFKAGVKPRLKNAEALRKPLYKPSNLWSTEKTTFGQNDYIDILGGGNIRPYEICYNIPGWLRGKKGNEFQLLLLKRRRFRNTNVEYENPKFWENMNKRLRYLHRYLNRKTQTSFMRD